MKDEEKKAIPNEPFQTAVEIARQRPVYTGSFDQQLQDLYGQITNRPDFQYDVNADPLYQQYKDQYVQQGKLAMKDTMGQAAALTGGYGSTYGQQVGQQAYDAYLQQLSAAIPELYSLAYDRYKDKGDRLLTQYGLVGQQRDTEYSRYRDELGDYNYERELERQQEEEAYERALQMAQTRAAYGDFSAYADLGYDEETRNNMRAIWLAQNPLLAYNTGAIGAEQYRAMTGVYPPGYAAPIAGGGSGGGSSYNYANADGLSSSQIKQIQKALGVSADGVWGPKTEAAYNAKATAQSTANSSKRDPRLERVR